MAAARVLLVRDVNDHGNGEGPPVRFTETREVIVDWLGDPPDENVRLYLAAGEWRIARQIPSGTEAGGSDMPASQAPVAGEGGGVATVPPTVTCPVCGADTGSGTGNPFYANCLDCRITVDREECWKQHLAGNPGHMDIPF